MGLAACGGAETGTPTPGAPILPPQVDPTQEPTASPTWIPTPIPTVVVAEITVTPECTAEPTVTSTATPTVILIVDPQPTITHDLNDIVKFDQISDSFTWTDAEKKVVKEGARRVALKLAGVIKIAHPSWDVDQFPNKAFLMVYGAQVEFFKTGQSCEKATTYKDCWGKTINSNKINVFTDSEIKDSASEISYHWTVHELGHAFIDAVGKESTDPTNPIKILETAIKENKHLGRPPEGSLWGFAGSFSAWQNSTVDSAAEVFADMYTGWVYNKWEVKIDENDNPVTDGNGNPVLTTDGQNRASFMNKHMSDWIEVAIKNEN